MANEPGDLNRLEDSLVHDEEETIPEGWALYTTQKFVSKALLLAYGILLVAILAAQIGFHGDRVLILFMPASAIIATPMALAAFYLDFVSPPEREEVTRKRTLRGRFIAVMIAFLSLGVITVALSLGLNYAFSLR